MTREDNIIKADPGKFFIYIPENQIWGITARIQVPYKGRILEETDFAEVSEEKSVNIDGTDYVFYGWDYNSIVEFIIKLHYSYDSQFAIILNYQQDPEQYKDVYDEMQEWRSYAKEIAQEQLQN